MNIDLDVLEGKAREAKANNADCVEAVTPDAVLELISTVRELEEQRYEYKKAYKQIRADWYELAVMAKRLAMSF